MNTKNEINCGACTVAIGAHTNTIGCKKYDPSTGDDPHNEFGQSDLIHDIDCEPLNFDLRDADNAEWWKHQDADITREDSERLEQQADENELRHNGYWT
jgi:hypothetical protein